MCSGASWSGGGSGDDVLGDGALTSANWAMPPHFWQHLHARISSVAEALLDGETPSSSRKARVSLQVHEVQLAEQQSNRIGSLFWGSVGGSAPDLLPMLLSRRGERLILDNGFVRAAVFDDSPSPPAQPHPDIACELTNA